MNLKQLHALKAVIDGGTVTSAASAMMLTQPAVSRLLLQLEGEIGFPLFHRSQGRLWATAEGEAFCQEASRVLAYMEHLTQLARDIKHLQVGHLRIITMPSIAYFILPAAIAEFSRDRVEVEIEIKVHQRGELQRAVETEPFDIGFASMPFSSTQAKVTPFVSADAVCVVPERHELAAKKEISAADLDGQPFIANAPGTLLRTRLDEIFAQEHVRPRQVLTSENMILACELAAEGLGIAIAHGILRQKPLRGVVVRPFANHLTMRYGLLLPLGRPHSSLASLLVRCVQAQVERTSAGGA